LAYTLTGSQLEQYHSVMSQAIQPPPQSITMQATRSLTHNPAVFDRTSTRAIEVQALAQTPAGELMQRAGEGIARLARALCPHARVVWVVCGPGNNGGDGLIAAAALARWGQQSGCSVNVSWAGPPSHTTDSNAALAHAIEAGAVFGDHAPLDIDLAIDAMLGIGSVNAPRAPMIERLQQLQAAPVVLCVDTPTGLNPDTGAWLLPETLPAPTPSQRRATLSLLTLKPGLFTGQGRDWAGEVWLDDLGVESLGLTLPTAALYQGCGTATNTAHHASHKGSFGQVTVIGGQTPTPNRIGMLGAAALAARAALHAGAGRVYWAPLGALPVGLDSAQPDLMQRSLADCWRGRDDARHVWVVGCGGGSAVAHTLPHVMAHVGPLVLDADALNHIAQMPNPGQALSARAQRGAPTVLTPHPLEAARLLGISVSDVQSNRLACAQRLANDWGVIVVLKGSGTVVTAPHQTPWINHSGNARLAIAGTGDVLAGLIGATLARRATGLNDHSAVRQQVAQAVWAHGHAADTWPEPTPLTASRLAGMLVPV
jgi:ADP-dependent NAD(P)H-hydrate dehydratase / NAD(P)H-hydrate epimerase